MKILMVNKFFYIKGGSETYYFALKELLEHEGHTVIDFSMKDDKNFNSKYEEYFVENIDYNKKNSIVKKIKMAFKIIYSFEAKNKFEQLIIKEEPDLIHLHIFQHQISPSVLDVARKYNIPVVYTAHDLKMVCLNYKMMHHKHICEDCIDGNYFHCVMNKCVKDSFSKSIINTIEGLVHRLKKSYNIIDAVITPSKFYYSKILKFGYDKEKVHYIPNFLMENQRDISVSLGKYYLYFGRISEEKGILTLVKAAAISKCIVYIVGSGPCSNDIEKYLRKNHIKNIKLLGFRQGSELNEIICNAKAVVIPSEWYENCPYSAIESLRLYKPLIGSNMGGIPELIVNNGYIFRYGDYNSLAEILTNFESLSIEDYNKLCNASHNLFVRKYTDKVHYNALIKVYNDAISKHNVK